MTQPSQWNCPNCGHEMISSGVDMESFEQICHETDALQAKCRELIEYWRSLDDGMPDNPWDICATALEKAL